VCTLLCATTIVIVGDAENEVTGAIRLTKAADGTSDIQGYVRGRWLSLSNDDPKNLFANGFEITRVAPDLLSNDVPVADYSAEVVSGQIVPTVSKAGAVDGAQTYAVISLQRSSTAVDSFAYRCDALDCSKTVGTLLALNNGLPSINIANGYHYVLGTGTGNDPSLVLASTQFPDTAPTTAPKLTALTVNIANPSLPTTTTALSSSLGSHNPVSAIMDNRMHAVYHTYKPAAYYGDAKSLMPCLGTSLSIQTPTTAAFGVGTTVGVSIFGTTMTISKNGYVLKGTSTTLFSSGGANNIDNQAAYALWVPPAGNPYNSGTVQYGLTADGKSFIVSYSSMTFITGGAAVTGQIIFGNDGVVRLEIASASMPPTGTISSGFFNLPTTMSRFASTGTAATAQTSTCFVLVPSSYVYLTCPVVAGGTIGTCDHTYFGVGSLPVYRNTRNADGHNTGSSPIAIHSLDTDPTNSGRFVFSALNCVPASVTATSCSTDNVRQLTLWTFSGTAGARFTVGATALTINLGGGDANTGSTTTGGAVDFDAEFTAKGAWTAVVALHGNTLEQFHWSYRVLSFATIPTTYTITDARILVTSVDLDTNGETLPFAATKLVRRGSTMYATLLIGNVNFKTTTGEPTTLTAGTPIIFRAADDEFKSTYVSFPSSYHAINHGAVVVWPHLLTDDLSVLSYPNWRGSLTVGAVTTLQTIPLLTRYTNGLMSPNAQECNAAATGRFYASSSRVYACVEVLTQDLLYTRSGAYTWSAIGTFDLRRQFARPNNRAPCS
jgi:hypothetical protein